MIFYMIWFKWNINKKTRVLGAELLRKKQSHDLIYLFKKNEGLNS